MTLKIEYLPVSSLKPYERNTRRHSDADVSAIMESIRLAGFNDPIGIWHNIIVEGHGRLEAARRIGMEKVPCIRLDYLTDEERRAYALLHNRTAELSEWDFPALEQELGELSLALDFVDFGDILPEMTHEESAVETQRRVSNILNLEYGDYPGMGPYDIPVLSPVYELPPIREWIGFNYCLSDKAPEGKAVHFFVDDYQFERLWNEPKRYIDILRRYVCVATPDFSPYGDMPMAAQIWNHYRKHWIGRFLQDNGVTVIPTLRSSTDSRFDSVWLDGEPYGGIALMSFMWGNENEGEEQDLKRFNEAVSRLKPPKMFIYGEYNRYPLRGTEVEFISTFTTKRFGGKHGKTAAGKRDEVGLVRDPQT